MEEMKFKTEQENFWASEFGDNYIDRNKGNTLLASNLAFFSRALRAAKDMKHCFEVGANIGMNLRALKHLYPNMDQSAVEINQTAAKQLESIIPASQIYNTSVLDLTIEQLFDLVLIKGVLIHINPELLPQVYEKLVAATSKYLLVAEYYNPSPVAVPYRGHLDRLFKRDFAGEIMNAYPEMKLVDYGFVSRHDPSFPQDDITWFLMEKSDA